MVYAQLKDILDNYDWDDGLAVPAGLLADSNCDLALALEIFYLAEGERYLFKPEEVEASWDEEWKDFLIALYNDILNGKFLKTETRFKIPLSKVAIYKLRKINIPEIFLNDL